MNKSKLLNALEEMIKENKEIPQEAIDKSNKMKEELFKDIHEQEKRAFSYYQRDERPLGRVATRWENSPTTRLRLDIFITFACSLV